jgi:hypothetical protein
MWNHLLFMAKKKLYTPQSFQLFIFEKYWWAVFLSVNDEQLLSQQAVCSVHIFFFLVHCVFLFVTSFPSFSALLFIISQYKMQCVKPHSCMPAEMWFTAQHVTVQGIAFIGPPLSMADHIMSYNSWCIKIYTVYRLSSGKYCFNPHLFYDQ